MKEMNHMLKRSTRWLLLVVVLAGAAAACSGGAAPPGASKALGSFVKGGYLFLRWPEGLEVMIVHDLAGEGTAHSSGFVAGPLSIERGSARVDGGRSLSWEVQTRDGTRGEAHIGTNRYDLAAGNLFLVTTRGGATVVRQLSRDLSAVALDHDGIIAFAGLDPDLVAFLDAIPPVAPPVVTPLPPTAIPTASLIATAVPTSSPAPAATPLPHTATSPSPTSTPQPAPAVERILFAPGGTQATIEGYLPDGGRARYVMGVAAGQFMEMNATAGAMDQGLRFSITGADGITVKPMGEAHIRTVVPRTQDYYVELVSDVGATEFRLSVLIPVRIRFAAGATSATVTGGLEEGGLRSYVLRALAGQRMIVAPHATTGQVGLIISGADGQVLLSGRVGQPGGVYDGILPASQDYLISVQARGGTGADYVLEITIPAEVASRVAIEGTLLEISPSARVLTLAAPVDGYHVIALAEDSDLRSAGGTSILLRDLRAGTRIQATGRPGEPGVLIAGQVLVIEN